MKSSLFIRAGAVLAFLVLLVAPAVAQQQTPARPPAPAAQPAVPDQPLPPKGTMAVVVDLLAIERDSRAFQSIRTQLERQRAAQQAEVAKLENDIRTAEQDLAKQRAVLSPDAFNQKRRDIEKRIGDAQHNVQTRRRDLDQLFGEAGNRVMANVQQIILEIAAEQQYLLVLPKNQIVAAHSSIEITSEVMKRLNTKMPTVTVAIPQTR